MSAMRYTLNADGTIEPWYLEKESSDGYTALRKTRTPKWNCNMRIFEAQTVYQTRKEARNGAVGRLYHFGAESEGTK